MSLNLASLLYHSADRTPDGTAQVLGRERVSYAELAVRAHRFAAVLKACGIRPGDRVGLMAPNVPAFTAAYFGILTAGAVVVPVNVLLVAEEVAGQLSDSGAAAFVLWEGVSAAGLEGVSRAPGCRTRFLIRSGAGDCLPDGWVDFEAALGACGRESGPVPTRPDDTAVIFYTSGTTGRPKGAEITHFNLYSNAQWVSEQSLSDPPRRLEWWGPGNVSLAALAFTHSFGQTCVQNASLFNGAAIAYLPRFTPDQALREMARQGVTILAAVPAMLHALLNCAEAETCAIRSLRFCLVGGAPIPRALVEAFEARYGAEVLEGYGLSETSPVIAFRSVGCPRRWGSVGRPIRGVEMRIVDGKGREAAAGEKGEIGVRGQPVMKGYYRQPGATARVLRDGWLATGDIGYLDEERNLFVVDRKKDTIIRNGFNVYPREVEEVLLTHPAVAEAAVVGVPDEARGEEILAVLVLKPGQDAGAEKIVAFCKARLAAYKYPRRVEFRDSLPKGNKGQVLRRVLREHEGRRGQC